jgi:ABC-2 type transport system permease protein
VSALALATASVRRLYRDRTALFFMLVLPVVIILVIGTVVRGDNSFRVGVVGAPGVEAARLDEAFHRAPAMHVHRYDSVTSARTALRRAELDSVVVIPTDMDATIAAGRQVEVTVYADPTNGGQRAAAQAVASVIAERAARLQASGIHREYAKGSMEASVAAVDAIAPSVTPVTVQTVVVDSKSGILPGGFSYSAPTMLVLFVFITSLAGGAAMIESRRLGIHARMLAGPVTTRSIVLGESLSYLGIALTQSAIIVGVGALVFGVSWGDPLAAGALVAVWALVGTGTGMLAGTVFRTPEQATAVGTTVGMAAGMLGGCMWPLEIVGQTMRTVGHAVPHAWAVDAWIKILSHGSGIGGIAPQLAVLLAFAVGLLALSSLRLHRRLTA